VTAVAMKIPEVAGLAHLDFLEVVPSPLQRTWMSWLSNGVALRKAAQVLGANCCSKRAWKVKSPARTMGWLIQ
jgi:hypothetical protein